jgi:predicted 3-demethylubiquinone-9 3-methyltransferase (glyoxalase superfamily)/RimJ/RimL family protein N-acetyltransferase
MRLRLATPGDLALLRAWDREPHVVAATGGGDFEWEAEELARTVPWREFLIAEVEGRPIGVLQIIDPEAEETHYWGAVAPGLRAIDIWIGPAADLGRGHGAEMMRLALGRCFADPSVTAVLIDPLAGNTRAHRFYERIGFRAVGPRRFGDDDCIVYRLERGAFETTGRSSPMAAPSTSPPQRIAPCLWMDGTAEDAARLYTSLFPDSRIVRVSRYGTEGVEIHRQPEGRVMVVEIELDGFRLTALNGGPVFRLNPSISLFVRAPGIAEAEALWAGLAAGGEVRMPLAEYPFSPRYGWTDDRFGVSWQVGVGPAFANGRRIAPFLMFPGALAAQTEAAMHFYASVFPNARIGEIQRQDGSGPETAGSLRTAEVSLDGTPLVLLASAFPHAFGFNEALSLSVSCTTQAEIDHLWQALAAGGGAGSQCGWLKDRYGVSWQVVPVGLARLLDDPDRAAAARVMRALLAMGKLDIAALEAAHRGA